MSQAPSCGFRAVREAAQRLPRRPAVGVRLQPAKLTVALHQKMLAATLAVTDVRHERRWLLGVTTPSSMFTISLTGE
jgi:hypothetical protein